MSPRAIEVVDEYGTFVVRFLAQQEGTWLIIAYGCQMTRTGRLNGILLPNWQYVVRELVALATPLKDRALRARTAMTGLYVDLELTFPLPASQLAKLVDAPEGEVRAEVASLIPEVK